jgi:hypothetical protein
MRGILLLFYTFILAKVKYMLTEIRSFLTLKQLNVNKLFHEIIVPYTSTIYRRKTQKLTG